MSRVFGFCLIVFLAMDLSSCLMSTGYVPPPRQVACTDDNVAEGTIAGCKTLAAQGDAQANARMGDYYDLREDIVHAYEWYRKAADLGHLPTIRKLYDDYRMGTKVPRNDGLSTEYLNKAAGLKAEWALLLLAKRSEIIDPNGAMDTYLKLARDNNCFAQARLAMAYYYGDIVGPNVTQAYFWALLATSGTPSRKSDYHVQTDLFAKIAPAIQLQGMVLNCSDVVSVTPKMEAEASLPSDRRQMAQDAATTWSVGLVEPQLPQPEGVRSVAAANLPPQPVQLPIAPQSNYPPPIPDVIHGRSVPDRLAIIIGIDGYENAPRASFAERDAAAFRAFAVTSMGIAEDNIRILLGRNAKRLDIERLLSIWLPGRIKPGQTSVVVYFSGHGLASDDGNDLYLLPYDGDRDLLAESSVRREKLIDRIKGLGAIHITLLLDACYSGLGRDGESLVPTLVPSPLPLNHPKHRKELPFCRLRKACKFPNR